MATFCRDCSLAIFGSDGRDLAEIFPPEAYVNTGPKEERMGALVLCECCGPICVDFNGKRMSEDFNESCSCQEMRQHHAD